VQNPVQQVAVLPRRGSQDHLPSYALPVLQGFKAGCEVVQSGRVEDRGLEPGAFPCGDRLILGQGRSESGSVGDDSPRVTSDLAILIDAWDSLPPDTRTAILAIVEAAQGR
jgi:hypothetical protein